MVSRKKMVDFFKNLVFVKMKRSITIHPAEMENNSQNTLNTRHANPRIKVTRFSVEDIETEL